MLNNLEKRLRFLRLLKVKVIAVIDGLLKRVRVGRKLVSLDDFLKVSPRGASALKTSTPKTRVYAPRWMNVNIVETQIKNHPAKIHYFENAVVMANSDFIFKNNVAIHPNLYSPITDRTTLEQNNMASLTRDYKRIKLPLALPNRRISKAVSLVGGNYGNYAHFLLECIPKLLELDENLEHYQIPVLLDSWAGNRFSSIFEFFNINSRPIFPLRIFETVLAEELIYIESPIYSPNDLKVSCPTSSRYIFSEEILEKIKTTSYSQLKYFNFNETYKLVYLRRRDQFKDGFQYNERNITNISAIEQILIARGFVFVDPFDYSFEELLSIMKGSKCVIGQLGAGLVNAIFCSKSTKVIGMGGYYDSADYSFFTSLFDAADLDFHLVVGPQQEKHDQHQLHRNHSLPINELLAALNS